MRKLKLPVIGALPERQKWLSMDEYIEFINFNRKYFPKTAEAKREEEVMRANVPFSIK